MMLLQTIQNRGSFSGEMTLEELQESEACKRLEMGILGRGKHQYKETEHILGVQGTASVCVATTAGGIEHEAKYEVRLHVNQITYILLERGFFHFIQSVIRSYWKVLSMEIISYKAQFLKITLLSMWRTHSRRCKTKKDQLGDCFNSVGKG